MYNLIINTHGCILCYISPEISYEFMKIYSIEDLCEMFGEKVRII